MAIRVALSEGFIAALEARTANFAKELESVEMRTAAEKVLRRRFREFDAFTAGIEALLQSTAPLKSLKARGKNKEGNLIYAFTLKGWEASFQLERDACTAVELYEVSFLLRRRKA
jgi:hypothetical protein